MKNNDPFQPWNNPMYKDDPFAPWNDPMRENDPFEPWNDVFGREEDLDEKDRQRYK